jgi:nickel/cobalt exporter
MRRRLLVVPILAAVLFATFALIGGPTAWAHPLGNFTINRYSGLLLSPGNVDIHYVVDMAEIPTFQETDAIDANADGSLDALELRTWSGQRANEMMASLALVAASKPVVLEVASHSARVRAGQAGLPVLFLEARFRGTLDQSSGNVRYSDGNFADRLGWKEVTARATDGLSISSSTVPAASISRELRSYPQDLLSTPPDVKEATLAFQPGGGGTAELVPGTEIVPGEQTGSGGSLVGLMSRPLTPLVLALSLILAFGLGALHAMGPGHGTTITAAYLIGRGARAREAAAVGCAVALMHTASVLALGLVVFVLAGSFPAHRVYPWLTLGTGLVAVTLGAGLLRTRIRGRRNSVPWQGHAHVHHEAPSSLSHHAPRPISGRGLLALAVAGGILPSPTAFVVLTGAVAAHRVGYGLALIFAFSLGLAASLTAVGLLALRAKAAVSARLAANWMGIVPIASAVVILGFGLFFASKGFAQLP